MEIVFELFANFLESVIDSQFYIRYFRCKEKYNCWFIALISIAIHFVVITFANYIAFLNLYGDIMALVAWILVSGIFLQGKIEEKTFVSGLCMIYRAAVIISFYSLLDGMFAYDDEGFMIFGIARVVLVMLAKLMDVIFYEFLIRFKSENSMLVGKKVYLQLNAMVFVTFFIENYLIRIYYNSSYENLIDNDAIVAAIALVLLDMIIYKMCMDLSKNSVELLKERMKNSAYDNRKKNIQLAMEQHEQTIKIRHDIKNEFLKIRMLLENEGYEDAKEYIGNVLDVKLAERPIFLTGNLLVDAVINQNFEQCNVENIKVNAKIDAEIEESCEMDIAVMLSNLFDNAIEATMKAKNKYIDFKMFRNKDYLCVHMKNSYVEMIVGNNGELLTTKKEKRLHGYGISSIQDIVSKYAGEYHRTCENNEFVTNVALFLPMKKATYDGK